MIEPQEHSGDVSDQNPYQVSDVAESAELFRQPNVFQILGAIVLAFCAGAIAFFSTCFGTGILLFEFASMNIHSDDPTGLILLAIVVGSGVAGLTILKTYRSLINFWTTYRERTTSPVHPETELVHGKGIEPGSDA